MHKRIVLIITIFFISVNLRVLAQDCWSEMADSLHMKINPLHDGRYHARFNFEDNTNRNPVAFEGTCYFSKDSAGDGNTADFIIFEHDTVPLFGYIGQYFYKFNTAKKQYTKQYLRRDNFFAKSTFDFQHFLAVAFLLNKVRDPFKDDLSARGDSSFCDCTYAGYMLKDVLRSAQYGEQTVKRYLLIKRNGNSDTIEVSRTVKMPDRTITLRWLVDSMMPIVKGEEFVRKKIMEFSKAYVPAEAKDLDDPNWVPPPPPPQPGEKLMKDTVSVNGLKTLDGKPYSLNQVGGKLILIDFWFANCAPCLKAMPEIENVYKKYSSKVLKVIGVNPYDYDTANIKGVLQKCGVDYPVYMDPDAAMVKDLGVMIYPTVLLVDPKSKKIYQALIGSDGTSELPAAIEKYLKRK